MALDLTRYESQVDAYFGTLPEAFFEIVTCPFCPARTESVALFTKGTLEIRRCRCGFVWNAHQPNQACLNQFYQASHAMDSWAEIKDSENENQRQLDKFTPSAKFLAGRKIRSALDVGCGNGVYLSILRRLLPDVEVLGTDLSKSALQACKRRGIPCEKWGIEESLQKNPKTYDSISLWGVLEHVKNPIGVLRWAHSRLNPNGYLVVCVPNVKSLVVTTLQEKCFTFCPQHLWYFDFLSLNQAFSQAHMEPIHFGTIEPERLPVARAISMLPPYDAAPEWAYAGALAATPSEETILRTGQGYKVVAIAQSIPPVRT